MKRVCLLSFGLLLLLSGSVLGQSSPVEAPCCTTIWRVERRPTLLGNCCCTGIGDFFRCCLAPLKNLCGRFRCCPQPDCDLSLAEMTASKIRADEASAHARRAAVRYLGTVDRNAYPEAEAALIAALRCDRCESVRLAAAKALARGCCCTPLTAEALQLVVSGGDRDGNPVETSVAVKLHALEALAKCMARGVSCPPRELPEALPTPGAPRGVDATINDGATLGSPVVGAIARTGIVQTGWQAASEAAPPAFLPLVAMPAAPASNRGTPRPPLTPIGVIPQ